MHIKEYVLKSFFFCTSEFEVSKLLPSVLIINKDETFMKYRWLFIFHHPDNRGVALLHIYWASPAQYAGTHFINSVPAGPGWLADTSFRLKILKNRFFPASCLIFLIFLISSLVSTNCWGILSPVLEIIKGFQLFVSGSYFGFLFDEDRNSTKYVQGDDAKSKMALRDSNGG